MHGWVNPTSGYACTIRNRPHILWALSQGATSRNWRISVSKAHVGFLDLSVGTQLGS
jgi:hypothetical protein